MAEPVDVDALQAQLDLLEVGLAKLGRQADQAGQAEQTASRRIDAATADLQYALANAFPPGIVSAIQGRLAAATDAYADAALAQDELNARYRLAAQKVSETAGQVDAARAQAQPPGLAQSAATGAGGIATALAGVTGALGVAAAATVPFVQAFSPSTILQFNQAVNDAMAVIGVALTPVLDVFTGMLRDVSAALYPIMERLAPVLASVANVVAQVVLPVLDTWASVLQALLPAIQVAADLLANLGTVARVGAAFMAGWVEQIRQWVTAFLPSGDSVKSFTDQVREAFSEVAKAAILVAGYLARLAGLTGFADGLLKSLRGTMAERKDATGLGAPTGARTTSVLDFSKSVMTAAFMATGTAAAPKTTQDWIKETIKGLEEIQKGNNESIDKVVKALKDRADGIIAWGEKYFDKKWADLLARLGVDDIGATASAAKFTVKTAVAGPWLAARAYEALK